MVASATQKLQRGVEIILDDPSSPRAVELLRALTQLSWLSLAAFSKIMWPVLEPGTPLEWSWHLDIICKELEWVTERHLSGKRARLVICVPPGTMKSLEASVFWPSWVWMKAPTVRFLAVASAEDLSTRDSRRMRDVVTSDIYQMMVGELARRGKVKQWELDSSQRSIVNFANSARGGRACFAIGGSITGHRGDGILIDDPHQVKDVLGTPEQVAAALERTHDKVDVALPSRVNDLRKAFEVVIQQRVHEDDVAGRRLKDNSDPDLRKVVLPVHFDPDSRWVHPDDPRKKAGELLDPVRLPEEVVQRLISKLDLQCPGQGQAQFEQRPTPAEGGLFKKEWCQQRYRFDPQRPEGISRWDEVVVTVDCTFKRTRRSDYVSAQTWGRIGWTQFYLLDEVHEKLSYRELRQTIRDFVIKWRADSVLIEEKANGAALIDDLKVEFPAIVPFIPDRHGDKVSRAHVTTPYFAAGNIWLPDAEWAPWIGDWVTEITAFPSGVHDDRVDAVTQLFIWWKERMHSGGTEAVNAAHNALLEALVPLGSQW